MVAINRDVEEEFSLTLGESVDQVGRLEVETSRSISLIRFNTGTATLVAPNKILTAAHVIDDDLDGQIDVEDLSRYTFSLGDNLEAGAEQSVQVSAVNLHPSWTASEENRVSAVEGSNGINPRYDLAVVTLDRNVTNIPPIPLSPNVSELADDASLLGQKGTLVGYGQFGSPSATRTGDGSRRAAENIIDSVENGLIRLDYDSTFESQQDADTGLNAPTLDSSAPELIPVPGSSPIPIPLEGGIGPGDSGGPLLVPSDLGPPVIAGVASEFIDTDVIIPGFASSGYGSVYVYTALSDPATLDFLSSENLVDLESSVAAGVAANSDLVASNNTFEQNDVFSFQDDLNLASNSDGVDFI